VTIRWWPAAIGLLLPAASAHATGVAGEAAADRRIEVALGAGLDQVGGYGRDTYPFVEIGTAIEARFFRHLGAGLLAGYRQDLEDYNFALAGWRHRQSPGLALRGFAGYDGPRFHLSVGPSLYGARRDRERFRVTFLPLTVVRLRVGSQDGWRFLFRLGDGVATTAEGGFLGLRALVGTPPRGRHRPSGGLYTTVGENVVGLTADDEIAGRGRLGRALRLGGCLGLDLVHPGRLEGTAFAGLLF
jgi:hypothetical protein